MYSEAKALVNSLITIRIFKSRYMIISIKRFLFNARVANFNI